MFFGVWALIKFGQRGEMVMTADEGAIQDILSICKKISVAIESFPV